VPRGEALAINVDSTHFAPHQPVASAGWHLTGIVGPGTARRIAMGPLLFDIGGGPTEPTSSILYGNPFDPSWTPRLYADYVATSTYPDALFDYLVASEDRPLAAGTFTFEPLAQPAALTLQGSPIGGMVEASPRAALQVDGTVADGTSSVSVAVWHLWRDTEGFHIDDVAYLVGDRLPFAVPAEVFQSGEKYVFEVTAYASDGDRNQTSTALSDEITFVAK